MRIASRLWGSILLLVLVIFPFGMAAWQTGSRSFPLPPFLVFDGVDQARPEKGLLATYTERFASTSVTDFVHAPTVTSLPNGDLLAAWFAGTREGAKDVVIRGVRFDAKSGQWGEEQTIVSREQTEGSVGRYIRKLGNPVLATAPDGKVWLLYVSVSIGGWAGSSINVMTSVDQGRTWSAPTRLITTPFWNVSTLVRSPPVFHENGVIGLPVYHEFLGKFPEYLVLDSSGTVRDKARMGVAGRLSLQPAVVALSPDRAIALLRYAGDPPNHLLGSFTVDRGASWSKPIRLGPENPNSSVAAIASGVKGWPVLVAQNNLSDGRFQLSLELTTDTLQVWQRLHMLDTNPNASGEPLAIKKALEIFRADYERAANPRQYLNQEAALAQIQKRMCRDGKACDFDFEYPTFTQSPDGTFHLAYAWNDTLIKHVSFNQAWLNQRLIESSTKAAREASK